MHFLLFVAIVTWPIVYINAQTPRSLPYCGNDTIKQQSIKDASKSEVLFGLGIYKKFYRRSRFDEAMSIPNIFIGLLKMYYAAIRETEKKMRTVLKIGSDGQNAQYGYQNLVDRIKEIEMDDFAVASQIFYHNDRPMFEQFKNIMNMTFRSIPQGLNFENKSEVTKIISEWIVNHTTIFPGYKPPTGIPTGNESLVHVGVSYAIKDKLKDFEACKNRILFHGYKPTERKFMRKVGKMNHGTIPGAKFVEISLQNNVSMYIIIPDQEDGLAELEQKITEETIRKIFSETRNRMVNVYLPQFSIRSFNQLPFDAAFPVSKTNTNEADFPGLTDAFMGRVSTGFDLVFLKFYAGGGKVDCGDYEKSSNGQETLKADRPFMIIIVTKGENPIILFIARFAADSI